MEKCQLLLTMYNECTLTYYLFTVSYVVDVEADEYYPTFLDLTRNLLDGKTWSLNAQSPTIITYIDCYTVHHVCVGNIESGPYEDCCREMFGVHGYIIFTIDRLIQNITKQVCNAFFNDNFSESHCVKANTLWWSYVHLLHTQF